MPGEQHADSERLVLLQSSTRMSGNCTMSAVFGYVGERLSVCGGYAAVTALSTEVRRLCHCVPCAEW